jgi:deoxyuridine 5'-triphosphate nucleotidohydrolase
MSDYMNNILLQLDGKSINEMEYQPEYSTSGSCGLDIKTQYDFTLNKGTRKLINTNLKLNINHEFVKNNNVCFILKEKSGLALKYGITLLGGTIDKDYDKEIGVILKNDGCEDKKFNKGDKICQMLTLSYYQIKTPNNTIRTGGFGSTGKK